MNERKGIQTSELWVTVGASLGTVVAGIISILVIKNYVSPEEAEVYKMIATSVIGLAIVAAPAYLGVRYGQGRAEVKAAQAYTQPRVISE